MFYGDPPTIEDEPVLPGRPYDRYKIPLPKELADEDYSKLDKISKETENEYILMWDYWEKNKEKRNE
eukprot:3402982-Ditylum_brightwellii.AAC.1